MPQSGSVAVQVVTSRAQLPVEGAVVVITQPGPTGKHTLLSLQETDRSGNTRPVQIFTPDLWQSTQPQSSELSFAQCDIWIEHPAFELLVVEGVQIFPGVESIQLVELNPLIRGEIWTQQPNIRPIPNQNL